MHLSREQAFDLWAGPSSPWSVWSKPIVFSYLPATITPRYDGPPALPPVESWAPHADGTTAIVVDLPGVRSVRIGEALAHAGFRPIPLFNAVPGPCRSGDGDGGDLARTLVDVYPIIEAIGQATNAAA